MVIAGSWDQHEGDMHSTPLAETPKAGAEMWRLRRTNLVYAPTDSSNSGTQQLLKADIPSYFIKHV